MSFLKNFKMDKNKEENGVSVTFEANKDGSIPTFILARMGPMNKKYQKTLERMTQPVKRQLELKTLAKEKADEIMMNVFIMSILLGWSNVQAEDGSKIEYSSANANTLFTQYPDLYFELVNEAQNAALYRVEETEAVAKN